MHFKVPSVDLRTYCICLCVVGFGRTDGRTDTTSDDVMFFFRKKILNNNLNNLSNTEM